MKLTRTQLKEIIREEIQKLSSNKSLRLKPIIENWVLSEDGETIVNPETGRKIKVSSALSYPKDHPAYKAAMKSKGGEDIDSTETNTQSTNTLEKPKMLDTVYKSVRKNMNTLADSMDSALTNMNKKFSSKSYKNAIKGGAFIASAVLGIGGAVAVAMGGAPAITTMGQTIGQYSTILHRALAPEAIGGAMVAVKSFTTAMAIGTTVGQIGGQLGVRVPAWVHRMTKRSVAGGISTASRGIANFADRKLKSRGITDSYNFSESIQINESVQYQLAKELSTIDPIEIKILEMMVQNNVLDKTGKITDYDKAAEIFKHVYGNSDME